MGYGSANNIEKVLLSWAGNWLCDPPNLLLDGSANYGPKSTPFREPRWCSFPVTLKAIEAQCTSAYSTQA